MLHLDIAGLLTLATFSCVASQTTPRYLPIERESCWSPSVEITVSPLISKTELRILDLAWSVGDAWSPDDWVGLYKDDPRINNSILFKGITHNKEGWIRTGIPEGRTFPEEPNFNETCLGFWAAYWKANSSIPLVTSCFKTNPNWMFKNKQIIQGLKIRETFFPGTHDSGAFFLAYSPFKENRFQKYVFAQDETILEQLIHGARYLDLRIGHYKGIFWLNHGFAKIHPLEHVLYDIKQFLNKTKEIVVLDLHMFPVGFTKPSVHQKLVQYLKDQLGEYMAPPSLGWGSTLQQIWNSDKRLIIAYNNMQVVSNYSQVVWYPVSQKWANVRTLSELEEFFAYLYNRRFTSVVMWSSMVELTPDTWGVVTDKYKGLRYLADSTNHDITSWFRGEWGSLCNAVAVDFIRSTGIVEAAIKWNKRRANPFKCDLTI